MFALFEINEIIDVDTCYEASAAMRALDGIKSENIVLFYVPV